MTGLWLSPEDDPRTALPQERGEKPTVLGYLAHYRLTLRLKCADLTPEQLATRSVPPSSMSLLGLVRHLARVEHHWARRCVEGHEELDRLYRTEEQPDLDFDGVEPTQACVDEAWASWEREVAHAETVYAAAEPDAVVTFRGEPLEVRDVLVHMVEEYARHLGHADLLRECLDGRTGV
ncbi:DinB family protein [Nocardioides bruguierae]|uniref:DinB family protein n=1 Tax=Nocardioides bruguierae TaxID=2945102 RepID=A0A9X2IFK9_9ACTN|nr:DinB family protein [Nocardioides bruguierae]MCM0620559.1 DinB family protein [Nocardioides bruguierae]